MRGLPVFAAAAVVLATGAAAADAPSGIFGRAAWRGQLVSGIVVYAYPEGAQGFTSRGVPRSEPTATDGTYSLPLQPGRYVLVARSGTAGQPRPGEYYCFYSGSPVTVAEGGRTAVGFNLVKVAEEVRLAGERSAIEGVVTYRDEPLEKLYLYLYDSADDGFRGPGLVTLPVGSEGRFRALVSPGTYYVIARKRLRGGLYGPMEVGDYFNYFPGNPVRVGEREVVRLNLETVTRISQLEEGETRIPTLTGTISDASGRPVGGLRVLAYRPGDTKGRPLFFSDLSTREGAFTLSVAEPGSYVLVARERFGGPAAAGELFGTYAEGLPVRAGQGAEGQPPGIVITVRATQ